MTRPTDRSLRPLAKTMSMQADGFDQLISQAVRDAKTLNDFTRAYGMMAQQERQGIIRAIAQNLRTNIDDSAPILAALLSVERNERTAEMIAMYLRNIKGDSLAPKTASYAFLAGNINNGGAVVVRALFASFVELLALAWDESQGITHAKFEPLIDESTSRSYLTYLPSHLQFQQVPIEASIDPITEAVWNHRKQNGAVPDCICAFADLFNLRV